MSCRANASAAAIALLPGIERAGDQLVQQPRALLEGTSERVLLGGQPAFDRLALVEQLGIGAGHQLAHDGGVAEQEPGRHLQAPRLQDRAAGEAAQDIAAVFVGGNDAVGDQERHAAGVVGEDAQRAVGDGILSGRTIGKLPAEVDQRLELVGIEHRVRDPAGSPRGD